MNYVDPTGHRADDSAGGGSGGGGLILPMARYLEWWLERKSALETATTKLAHVVAEAADDVWSYSKFLRGQRIEELLMKGQSGWFGSGNNVPTIDGYTETALNGYYQGIATSVKSMDLAAESYQTASGITGTLGRIVDKFAEFQGGFRWAGNDIGQITQRVLRLAIPDMTLSSEQAAGLKAAQDYAIQKGITLVIEVVK